MNIIHKGTPPGNISWIGKCGECGTVVRALQSELGKIEPGDYRSDNEAWSRADCTVCGKKQALVLHPESTASAQRDLEYAARVSEEN